jgi:hypothetical protein
VTCWLYARAYGDYGWILDKKIRETDSFGLIVPPETIVTTVTENNSNKGHVGDFSLGLGNHFQLMAKRLTIAPMVGFGYHTQQMRTKGSDKVVNELAALGVNASQLTAIGFVPTSGGSKYRTSWWGPWVGVDFYYNTCCQWLLFGEFEYYFASRCNVKRNSNIGVGFFDDYHKTNSMRGWRSRLGSSYFFACNLYASLDINYQYLKSHHAKHHFTWHSIGIGANLGYAY